MATKKSSKGKSRSVSAADLQKAGDTLIKTMNVPDDPKSKKVVSRILKDAYDGGYVVNFQLQEMPGRTGTALRPSCACICICACLLSAA
jgi:hypothetical protein